MDFREHQDLAKRNSRIIWLLYILLLLTSSFLIGYTMAFLTTYAEITLYLTDQGQQISFGDVFIAVAKITLFRNPEQLFLFMGIAFFSMTILTIFGWYRRSNGHQVALAFGGRLISLDDKKLTSKEKQTLNIVAEQALAASIKAPALYVIPEKSINAFAAGKKTEEAIIAVTEGSLESFNRTQLEGVIAHEMGHIVNEDIRLNIKISAFVFGFTALFFLARMIFYQSIYGGRRMDPRMRIVLVGVAIIIAIIGALTVWFGRLLQAAMSRQREYLADASAVQFTRYPDGLVEAFEVIKAGGKKSVDLENPNSREYAHALMFGISGELFSTHPSLDKRIARIKGLKF